MALHASDVDLDRDRDLVRRFQAGEDQAFDELYRRYYDRLERFCRKRVGDPFTAEEVAQEAFARALTALPDLGGDLRFYPWVSVIAAHLCVDSHRRQSRSEPSSDLDAGAVPGGQEEIVDAVDASLVIAALARLAPRHQDVLHLREVEGWSYRRIADHYGVTVGTVETLLFRARRALRREFHIVDGGGMAAIPVLAVLSRWAGRVRSKVPAWVPSPPSPAAMASAATATAAAVALVVVPGAGRFSPATPSTPTPQASVSALSGHATHKFSHSPGGPAVPAGATNTGGSPVLGGSDSSLASLSVGMNPALPASPDSSSASPAAPNLLSVPPLVAAPAGTAGGAAGGTVGGAAGGTAGGAAGGAASAAASAGSAVDTVTSTLSVVTSQLPPQVGSVTGTVNNALTPVATPGDATVNLGPVQLPSSTSVVEGLGSTVNHLLGGLLGG